MALVDDVEFYARAVAQREISWDEGVRRLIGTGQFTERSANDAIGNPLGYRERIERLAFECDELLRVIDIGNEDKAKEFALDMVRRAGRRNAREMLRDLRHQRRLK